MSDPADSYDVNELRKSIDQLSSFIEEFSPIAERLAGSLEELSIKVDSLEDDVTRIFGVFSGR